MLMLKALLLISQIICALLFSSVNARVYEFTEHNELILLQEARAAADLKLELVRNAKHHIHIMTYYWDKQGFPQILEEELKKANDRGVDVRIMTTYLPTLSTDFWGKSKEQLFAEFKESSSSKATLAYLTLTPGNNESITDMIHEKIFLVDGEVAILGGRNVSDNAFLAKDLEVMMRGPVVNQVQDHFKMMFSFLVELKIKDDCKRNIKYEECSQKINNLKFSSEDKKFFPDQPEFSDGAKARILTNELLIQQYQHNFSGKARFNAKDDIIDTVIQTDFSRMRAYNYFILPLDRYKKYLETNLANGKSIQIISNSLKTAGFISDKGYLYGLPEMKNLVSDGLELHQWLGGVKQGEDQLFYLHEKVMLFDDDHGIIGSHNFGAGSTGVSSEIVVEFYSKPIVQTLADVFDSEFSNSEITQNATLPMLDEEIKNNKKMIRILRFSFIGTLIKELY